MVLKIIEMSFNIAFALTSTAFEDCIHTEINGPTTSTVKLTGIEHPVSTTINDTSYQVTADPVFGYHLHQDSCFEKIHQANTVTLHNPVCEHILWIPEVEGAQRSVITGHNHQFGEITIPEWSQLWRGFVYFDREAHQEFPLTGLDRYLVRDSFKTILCFPGNIITPVHQGDNGTGSGG